MLGFLRGFVRCEENLVAILIDELPDGLEIAVSEVKEEAKMSTDLVLVKFREILPMASERFLQKLKKRGYTSLELREMESLSTSYNAKLPVIEKLLREEGVSFDAQNDILNAKEQFEKVSTRSLIRLYKAVGEDDFETIINCLVDFAGDSKNGGAYVKHAVDIIELFFAKTPGLFVQLVENNPEQMRKAIIAQSNNPATARIIVEKCCRSSSSEFFAKE